MSEDRRVERSTFWLLTRPTEFPEEGDKPDAYDIGFEFDDEDYEVVWVDDVPHAKAADGTLRPYIDGPIRDDPKYKVFIDIFDKALRDGNTQLKWAALRALVLHMEADINGMRGEKALLAIREAKNLLDEIDVQMDIQMEWAVVMSLAQSAQSKGESTKMRRQARGKGIEWSRSDSRGRDAE